MTGEQGRRTPVRQLDDEVIAVELDDRTVLMTGICPHRKGKLRYGKVDPEKLRITCPLHHSTFSVEAGERLAGPACDPLRIYDAMPESEPEEQGEKP